jgi:hypothetical protein
MPTPEIDTAEPKSLDEHLAIAAPLMPGGNLEGPCVGAAVRGN